MNLDTFYSLVKNSVEEIGLNTMDDETRAEIIRNVADDLGSFHDLDTDLIDDAVDAVCFYFDETILSSNQQ